MALEMLCQARIAGAGLASLLLLGCASTRLSSGSEAKCPADPSHMSNVSIAAAFDLTSQQLACYGSELRLECGLLHGISENDREACRTYTAAVVTFLSRDSCAIVTPSLRQPVQYKDSGVCIDTFVPGRELDDCFDFIEAKIPLEPSRAAPSNKSLERTRER
jgi:hypothetical protein